MEILDVNARWPGSHNDSFILNSSSISDRFNQGEFGDSCLLGDSGYALKSWLMTPYLEPATREEREFNRAHKKTRCYIERCFGAMKSRWRIIDHTGGYLCYLPSKVSKIVVTCSVLHNICRRNGTPLVNPTPISRLISFEEEENTNNRQASANTKRSRLASRNSANVS